MARKIPDEERRPSIGPGFLERHPDEIKSNIERINYQLHKAGILYNFTPKNFMDISNHITQTGAHNDISACSSILDDVISSYLEQVIKVRQVAKIVDTLKSIMLQQLILSRMQNDTTEERDNPHEGLDENNNYIGFELSGSSSTSVSE